MEKFNKFIKFISKIIFYAIIFSCIFFIFYKFINWRVVWQDYVNIDNQSIVKTSEFDPEILSLGLDYESSMWISRIKKSSSDLGFDIKSIIASTTDRNMLELTLENGTNLRVNLNRNLDKVLSNLKVLYSSQAFKQELSKGIDYIDLRYDNKVYYKLISTTSSATSSSVASTSVVN